jgi:tetratricopeptide (TPR) repeat protein
MLPRLAYAFEQIGRPGDALEAWQSHVQLSNESDATAEIRLQLHMGRLALQATRFDDALELLPEAGKVADAAMAAETLFWRAEAYYQLQRWEAAQQQYQELLRHHETSHWSDAARLRLGTVYEQQQEWDLALETYRRLREVATDAKILANAESRITAIEAGLVRSRPPTQSPPSKKPPSSEG